MASVKPAAVTMAVGSRFQPKPTRPRGALSLPRPGRNKLGAGQALGKAGAAGAEALPTVAGTHSKEWTPVEIADATAALTTGPAAPLANTLACVCRSESWWRRGRRASVPSSARAMTRRPGDAQDVTGPSGPHGPQSPGQLPHVSAKRGSAALHTPSPHVWPGEESATSGSPVRHAGTAWKRAEPPAARPASRKTPSA